MILHSDLVTIDTKWTPANLLKPMLPETPDQHVSCVNVTGKSSDQKPTVNCHDNGTCNFEFNIENGKPSKSVANSYNDFVNRNQLTMGGHDTPAATCAKYLTQADTMNFAFCGQLENFSGDTTGVADICFGQDNAGLGNGYPWYAASPQMKLSCINNHSEFQVSKITTRHPDPQPVPDPEPGPDPQPGPEPQPGPDPQPGPEPDPEPGPDPNPESPTAPALNGWRKWLPVVIIGAVVLLIVIMIF